LNVFRSFRHRARHFSEAVKLDPKMASGYYQRGNAYFEKRD
jgi:hypothetical protein